MQDAETTSHWIDMFNMDEVFFNIPIRVGEILHIDAKVVFVDLKKSLVQCECNCYTIDGISGQRIMLLEDKNTTTELTYTYKVDQTKFKCLPIMPADYLESLAYLKARSEIQVY